MGFEILGSWVFRFHDFGSRLWGMLFGTSGPAENNEMEILITRTDC